MKSGGEKREKLLRCASTTIRTRRPTLSERKIERARNIVKNSLYATVATADEGATPWNSPVFVSLDNDGNFYWISSPEAQHSKNISANNKAFLVMFDSTAPEGTGEGVYVQATAEAVSDQSCATYLTKRAGKPDNRYEEALNQGVLNVYRATPQHIWVNDVELDENGEYVRDTRPEIPTDCLTKLADW